MELPAAGQSEARASPGRVAFRSPIRNLALRSPARRVPPPRGPDAAAPAPSVRSRYASGQLSGLRTGLARAHHGHVDCVLLQPVVGGDVFTDDSSETAKVRRLSKENRTLRQKLKELQLEAAEEKEEVDSLIEELSKEIIELCEGLLGSAPQLRISDLACLLNSMSVVWPQDGREPAGAPHQ